MPKPQAGAALSAVFTDLHRLYQEHTAYQKFVDAVSRAIKKHPQMSEWIGDEQQLPANDEHGSPAKTKRSRGTPRSR